MKLSLSNKNLIIFSLFLNILFTSISFSQEVVKSAEFGIPISEPSIIYASMRFNDVNNNGSYDASFVLSESEIYSWDDYSAAIAFYSNIEVRDGDKFSGSSNLANIAVEPDIFYHFWIEIDPLSKTYTTWVRSENMLEPQTIFANASFRNKNINTIKQWSSLNNPLGEPDIVEVNRVSLVENVGDLPNLAMFLPGGSDGSKSNIAIPPLNISELPLTIEMWYKPDPIQPYYSTLWYNRSTTDNSGVQYDRWIDSEKIKGVWQGASGDGLHPNKPLVGKWNHVALVMTEDSKTLYLNGVPFTQTGNYNNYPFDEITYIGWDNALADRTLTGLVNEIRVWTHARTAHELEENKNNLLSGEESGLLGYWNFNLEGSTVMDLSGNGRKAVISGGTYIELDNALLSSISLSVGSLDKPFSPLISEYNVLLPSGTTSVSINAEAEVSYGTSIDIDNDGIIDVSSGSAEVHILVWAADDLSTKSYTLMMEVNDETKDAGLSMLSTNLSALNPVFRSDHTNYEVILPIGTNSVEVEATTNTIGATVAGAGTIFLENGFAVAVLEVTASDGITKKVYTIEFNESDTFNYALSLPGGNGKNSNIDISGLALSSLPYTIEMWIKPNGSQNDNTGLFYHRGSSHSGIQYSSNWQGSGKLRLMTDIAQNDYGTVSDIEIKPDEWHHIAAVVTSESSTLYVNGTAYSRNVGNADYDFSIGSLHIGWDSDQDNRAFKGEIDEVRVWQSAKTEQEILENQFSILSGDEPDLLAYWNFDLLNPAQAVDLSVEKVHGLINGGSYVVSSLFTSMEFSGAVSISEKAFVNINSISNPVSRLTISTKNQKDPLSLTNMQINASGTPDLGDLQKVSVYSTGNQPEFDTKNLIAEFSKAISAMIFFDLDHSLLSGDNYFWITVDIPKEAIPGNKISLVCDEITMLGSEGFIIGEPEISSAENYLTINPDYFINNYKFPIDILTDNASTAVEGANFVSFQQNAIMTHNGYQYVTYWNSAGRVCLSRKKLPDGDWETITFSDHTISPSSMADNHHSISMGICKNDGSIHLSFDHHNNDLRYKKSIPGLADKPEDHSWSASSFGEKVNYLIPGSPVRNMTYPRFISKPDGDLIFECRIGWSGNGDSFLWTYSGENGTWEYIGEYLHGTSKDENAYINGLHYDINGRLHVSWIWRRTPDPLTNHDIYYAYSDDDGRTWYNSKANHIASVNSSPMTLETPGLKIWDVGNNRGLINQESQAVDGKGRIHILQSYIPDYLPNDNNFWGSRITNGYLHHIFIDDNGVWHNNTIAPSGRNRSEIAVDANDNVYVVAGNYRVYFAAASGDYKVWTSFDLSESNTGMNEGLIDREALLNENVLSFVFAHSDNDGKIIVPYYQLENSALGSGDGINISVYRGTDLNIRSIQYKDDININRNFSEIDSETAYLVIEGEFETIYPEPYTLYLNTSENLKIEINDKTVLETGELTQNTEFVIHLPHVPFHKNRIKIDGNINPEKEIFIQLQWESVSQEKSIIPLSSLYGKLFDSPTGLHSSSMHIQNAYCVPNPFISSFTLIKSGKFYYSIHNINGVLITEGQGEDNIELGIDLKEGIYFATIIQDKNKEIIRVLKK